MMFAFYFRIAAKIASKQASKQISKQRIEPATQHIKNHKSNYVTDIPFRKEPWVDDQNDFVSFMLDKAA